MTNGAQVFELLRLESVLTILHYIAIFCYGLVTAIVFVLFVLISN